MRGQDTGQKTVRIESGLCHPGPILLRRADKVSRIVAPFGLSTVLFVLAYPSSKDSTSRHFPIMLMGIGIVLAIVGIAAIFSTR